MPSLETLLKVNKHDLSSAVSGAKRFARVEEAISWSLGAQGSLIYQTIWESDKYKIKLGKPGKEAAADYDRCKYLEDGHRGNNPNDMKPEIFCGNELFENKVASFTGIFDELQVLHDASETASELMACLLFRSAYMVDHKEVSPGIWRYEPSKEIINTISQDVPEIDGMPVEVFLHFLDALAWNEDVKYYTLGYNIKSDYGRRNNLMTCVNIIAVLLNRVRISKFAGSFSRPPAGISAISKVEALKQFPMLRGDDL
jgi:hypothetical protein